jgi:hypothetical protein
MSADAERLARSEVRERVEAAFTFAVEDIRVRTMKVDQFFTDPKRV